MRRQATILLTVTWLTLGLMVAPTSRTWADTEAATLKSVTLSSTPAGAELVLRVEGAYSYKTVQAAPETLFVDLAGAKAEGVVRSQDFDNPVFSGCKVLSYKNSKGEPVVRVQVETKVAIPLVVAKAGQTLRLFEKGQNVAAAAAPPAAPSSAVPRLSPPANSEGRVLVSNVTFDKQPFDEVFVNVSTSRSATYRVSTLPNPARLIVDIDHAQKTCTRGAYAADTAILKAVRVGQLRADAQASVVRVVADLNGNPLFDVHSTPAGVRIELRPRGMAKSSSLASSAPKPAASIAPDVKSIASTAPAPKPAVPIAADVKSIVFPAPVPKLVASAAPAVAPNSQPYKLIPVAQIMPPVHEERPAPVVTPEVQSTLPATVVSPQASAAPLPPPPSVTPEALRARQAAQTVSFGMGKDAEAAQGVVPGSALAPTDESKPVYTGEPISVNFKDVDIKDFFREIHEISGLNIIVDPNVSGTVTMVLDSVPWDQALDIVLKNNGLGRVMEGNVLRIARLSTLTAEQQEQTKLADARVNAAPLVTVFRPVNYAKASDIATLLKTWAGGGALSRRGTVLVDARANTLIISDIQSQIPIIMNILSKLDRKAKQISIEARVVLATADFTRTLSSSLNGGWGNKVSTASAVTGANSSITVPVPTTAQPFPIQTVTSAASSGFGAAAITNATAKYFINATISAAEERDQAKTISRPTIVTQNNVQGMVQQGVQIPEETNINNTITVQYVSATLQLSVTPQVTDDNNIFLIINVNNASVGAVVSQAGPAINTQQATTQVLVPDGGTVVFGGITVTSRSKSATYIPLLGNIPVLGHLFKTSNTTDNDQELLFFVSPTILPG